MYLLEITTESALAEAADMIKDAKPGFIRSYFESLVPGLMGFALQIVLAAVVYIIGSRLINLARRFLRKWLERADADVGAKQFMDSLLKAVLYFILIIFILTFFGVTAASVVAVIGSAGLTLGLALQGSLSNFAGGVLILMLKPFRVGDYIKEDTRGNEGTVSEISIFYTKLLTFDNKTVVVPNGTLANSSLTNVTHSDKRRVDLLLGIAYDADLKKAKDVIEEVAKTDIGILKDEEVRVFVSELAESHVKIGCRVWAKTEEYWDVKWRLTENIKLALDKNDIEIPYQKIDVHMRS